MKKSNITIAPETFKNHYIANIFVFKFIQNPKYRIQNYTHEK